MADDVILREQIWGFRGMPVLAHPLYTPALYAEIYRVSLVLNKMVSHLGIMNRVVSDRYDELEEL